jgi:glycine betaine/proline transport system permease protein
VGQRWRVVLIVAILAAWVTIWSFTNGQDTLDLAGRERTDVHRSLTGFRDAVIAGRDTNPFLQLTTAVAEVLRTVFDWLQRLVSVPNLPRPVPDIGWLGVVALATWVAYAIANLRIVVLVGLSFLSFGLFGYWEDSIDLLLVTLMAVAITVVIGIPVAIWIASSDRANSVVTVFLDLMQTMPAFVYLAPVTLFFGIGPSGAVVLTLVYALPPIIRIAAHGIRSVSTTTIEATDSAGQSPWQRLTKVQLPMARRTIIVGLNQTIMAALVDGHPRSLRRRSGPGAAGARRAQDRRRRPGVRSQCADRRHGGDAGPDHDGGQRARRAVARGCGEISDFGCGVLRGGGLSPWFCVYRLAPKELGRCGRSPRPSIGPAPRRASALLPPGSDRPRSARVTQLWARTRSRTGCLNTLRGACLPSPRWWLAAARDHSAGVRPRGTAVPSPPRWCALAGILFFGLWNDRHGHAQHARWSPPCW